MTKLNKAILTYLARSALAGGALTWAGTVAASDSIPSNWINPAQIRPDIVRSAGCHPPSFYPEDALRNEEEGVTILAVLVRADGTPAETQVLLSSGHPDLDAAGQRGMARCQFKPGTENGVPVTMWYEVAFFWRVNQWNGQSRLRLKLGQAAKEGDVSARVQLASLLSSEAQTETDRRRAVSVMRSAAELGHPMAQFVLATCYEDGTGVEANNEEAKRWFEQSAAQGNVLALERLRLGALPRPSWVHSKEDLNKKHEAFAPAQD